jgi:hypothetical protein
VTALVLVGCTGNATPSASRPAATSASPAASDPAVAPSPGHVLWRFPVAGSLPAGETFSTDDAFLAPDGKTITANEEGREVVVRIDVATNGSCRLDPKPPGCAVASVLGCRSRHPSEVAARQRTVGCLPSPRQRDP